MPLHAAPSIDGAFISNSDGENKSVSLVSIDMGLTSFASNVTDATTLIHNWWVNGTPYADLLIPFDTNVSTTAVGAVGEYSSHNQNGTLSSSGGITWLPPSSCVSGGCYQFDGASFISFPDPGSTSTFSVEAWIYPTSITNDNTHIVGKDGGNMGVDRSWGLMVDTAGHVKANLFTTGGSVHTITSTSTVPMNQWSHVALTYYYPGTAGSGKASLYARGVQNNVSGLNGPLFVDSNDITIGKRERAEDPGYFTGRIDQVLIYNRTLSMGEILAHNSSRYDRIVPEELSLGEIWNVTITPNSPQDGDGASITSSRVEVLSSLPVDSCANLSTSGSYSLNQSIAASGGTCFNISAEDVKLDCKGFAILGDNSTTQVGILSSANRTTIRNCQISNFTSAGIYLNNSSSSSIDNSTIQLSFSGAVAASLSSSSHDNLTNSTLLSLSGTSVQLDSQSASNIFATNNITGTVWVDDSGTNNSFNFSSRGNAYYFTNGTGAYSVYDFIDTTGDNWADEGADVPFGSTSAGAIWLGSSSDNHPYTAFPAPFGFISVSASPAEVSIYESLNCQAEVFNDASPTSDAAFNWYLNGTLQPSLSGVYSGMASRVLTTVASISSPNISAGDIWSCAVNVSYNFTNSSGWHRSGNSTIIAAEHVDSCREINVSNQAYVLNQSIIGSGTSCLAINAHNITFDCSGHTIMNKGSYALYVQNTNDVTIKNCVIQDSSYGVYAVYVPNLTAVNNSMNNGAGISGNGIFGYQSPNFTATNNSISGPSMSEGIYLVSSGNSTIADNTISIGAYYGLDLEYSNNVSASGNSVSAYQYSLYLYSCTNCSLSRNSFSVTNDYNVYDYANSNTTFSENNFTSPGAAYDVPSSNMTFLNNRFVSTSVGPGVYVSGSGNLFIGNVFISPNISVSFFAGSNTLYSNYFDSPIWVNGDKFQNEFNTTVDGIPQGNNYSGIDAYGLLDLNGDGYADSGTNYPLNSTFAPAAWLGLGTDSGPAVAPAISIQNISLSPSSPTVFDTLYCNVTALDQIQATLNISFEWYKDGANQTALAGTYLGAQNSTSATISNISGVFHRGENWSCRARGYDGTANSTWVQSANVTIAQDVGQINISASPSNGSIQLFSSSGQIVSINATASSAISSLELNISGPSSENHTLATANCTGTNSIYCSVSPILPPGAYSLQATVGDSYGSDRIVSNFTVSSTEGNASTINASGVSNVSVKIDGIEPANTTNITGVQTVNITSGGEEFIAFSLNFSSSGLNLTAFNFTNATTPAGASYVEISGLPPEIIGGKNITIYGASPNYSMVCVKDAPNATISQISSGCGGANETLLYCNNTIVNGKWCNMSGTTLRIFNLTHSAAVQFALPASQPGGSGGQAPSLSYSFNCSSGALYVKTPASGMPVRLLNSAKFLYASAVSGENGIAVFSISSGGDYTAATSLYGTYLPGELSISNLILCKTPTAPQVPSAPGAIPSTPIIPSMPATPSSPQLPSTGAVISLRIETAQPQVGQAVTIIAESNGAALPNIPVFVKLPSGNNMTIVSNYAGKISFIADAQGNYVAYPSGNEGASISFTASRAAPSPFSPPSLAAPIAGVIEGVKEAAKEKEAAGGGVMLIVVGVLVLALAATIGAYLFYFKGKKRKR